MPSGRGRKLWAARPRAHGDAGYLFELIGGYRMELILWEGDEEFPPSSQILYSDTFAEGFSAEDRVVAGDILITARQKQYIMMGVCK